MLIVLSLCFGKDAEERRELVKNKILHVKDWLVIFDGQIHLNMINQF